MMRLYATRALGRLAGLAVFASLALPAMAQQTSTFTNPLCTLVNFRFCDQGSPPAAVPPPPQDAERVPPPPLERAQARSAKVKIAAHKTKRAQGKEPKEPGQKDDVDSSRD